MTKVGGGGGFLPPVSTARTAQTSSPTSSAGTTKSAASSPSSRAAEPPLPPASMGRASAAGSPPPSGGSSPTPPRPKTYKGKGDGTFGAPPPTKFDAAKGEKIKQRTDQIDARIKELQTTISSARDELRYAGEAPRHEVLTNRDVHDRSDSIVGASKALDAAREELQELRMEKARLTEGQPKSRTYSGSTVKGG